MPNEKTPVTLSLSGSGARFPAFVGTIDALKDSNLDIVAIGGVSGGSIVSALVASGIGSDDIMAFAKDLNFKKLLKPRLTKFISYLGISRGDEIEKKLRYILKSKRFKDLNLPCKILSANLDTEKKEVFYNRINAETINYPFTNTNELLRDTASLVRTSISIPFIFKPKQLNGHHYVDGGMVMNYDPDLWSEFTNIPQVGIKLISKSDAEPKDLFEYNIVGYVAKLLKLTTSQVERAYESDETYRRTLFIHTKPYGITNFDLSSADKQELYDVAYSQTIDNMGRIKKYIDEVMQKQKREYTK